MGDTMGPGSGSDERSLLSHHPSFCREVLSVRTVIPREDDGVCAWCSRVSGSDRHKKLGWDCTAGGLSSFGYQELEKMMGGVEAKSKRSGRAKRNYGRASPGRRQPQNGKRPPSQGRMRKTKIPHGEAGLLRCYGAAEPLGRPPQTGSAWDRRGVEKQKRAAEGTCYMYMHPARLDSLLGAQAAAAPQAIRILESGGTGTWRLCEIIAAPQFLQLRPGRRGLDGVDWLMGSSRSELAGTQGHALQKVALHPWVGGGKTKLARGPLVGRWNLRWKLAFASCL